MAESQPSINPASLRPVSPVLSAADVRAVADLARLQLSDEQVEVFRAPLGAVLGYMDRLSALDLRGVEPMSHPNDSVNRLDIDEVRTQAVLPNAALMAMAPAKIEPFVQVPRVLDDGGGA